MPEDVPRPSPSERVAQALEGLDDEKLLLAVEQSTFYLVDKIGEEKLPPVLRLIFWGQYCTNDIANGGFHQLFYNSTGNHYKELRSFYEQIGAHEFVDAIDQAIAVFPEPPSEQREERIELLEELETEDFEDADNKFFDLLNSDAFGEVERKTALFIRQHVREVWPEGFNPGSQ